MRRLADWDEAAGFSARTRLVLFIVLSAVVFALLVVVRRGRRTLTKRGVALMDSLLFTALTEPFVPVRGDAVMEQDRRPVLARRGVLWSVFVIAVATAQATHSPPTGGIVAVVGMTAVSLASSRGAEERRR